MATNAICNLGDPQDGKIEVRYTEADLARAKEFAELYLHYERPVIFPGGVEPTEDEGEMAIIAFLKSVECLNFPQGGQIAWVLAHPGWDGETDLREWAEDLYAQEADEDFDAAERLEPDSDKFQFVDELRRDAEAIAGWSEDQLVNVIANTGMDLAALRTGLDDLLNHKAAMAEEREAAL